MIIFHDIQGANCTSNITFACKKNDIEFMQFWQSTDNDYVVNLQIAIGVNNPYCYCVKTKKEAMEIIRKLASYEDTCGLNLEIFSNSPDDEELEALKVMDFCQEQII